MSGRKPAPCVHCQSCVNTEHYVYFGVVGPFCDTSCREWWLIANRPDVHGARAKK